jgi:molybdenum cofactor biosynthesis protein MoaC
MPRSLLTPRLSLARCYSSSVASRLSPGLTHLDHAGRPSMVDVAEKKVTKRSATASGRIYIPSVAYDLVTSTFPDSPSSDAKLRTTIKQQKEKSRRKGDALTVAQLAAIMGCKKTSDLIPLCHPLPLTHISVTFKPELLEATSSGEKDSCAKARHSILCQATVSCESKTGVEMEALTAVSVGLLTLWDMLKAVAGKEMCIGDIMVTHKAGGRSGDFTRLVDGGEPK